MIHPGFISAKPNQEIFLTNIRTKIEKDYKKISILSYMPVTVLLFLIISYVVKSLEFVDWTFRVILLVILLVYMVIALPLMAKKKLLRSNNPDAIRVNVSIMKAYYLKATTGKWRFIALVIVCLILGTVLTFYIGSGVESFRESTKDGIFSVVESFFYVMIYITALMGSYFARKRNAEAIKMLEENYKSMGVNM